MFSLSVELSSTLLPYVLFSIGLPTLLMAQCWRRKTQKKPPLKESATKLSNQKPVVPVALTDPKKVNEENKEANKKECVANEKKNKSEHDGDEKKPEAKDNKDEAANDKDKTTGAEAPKTGKSLIKKENTAKSLEGKKVENKKPELEGTQQVEDNDDYQQVEFGEVPPPPAPK